MAYVSDCSLQRVAKNNGVLAQIGFLENMANSPNNVLNIPLYRGD